MLLLLGARRSRRTELQMQMVMGVFASGTKYEVQLVRYLDRAADFGGRGGFLVKGVLALRWRG